MTKHRCAPQAPPRATQHDDIEIMKKTNNSDINKSSNAAIDLTDQERAERAFEMQRQMGEELLNRLGYSESKTDLRLWMRLSLQATLNQVTEARHLNVDGNCPVREVEFTVRVPDDDALEDVLDQVVKQLPELKVHSMVALAEVVDDRRVKFRGKCELSTPVLTGFTTKLIVIADEYGGSLEDFETVDDFDSRMGKVMPTNLTRCYSEDVLAERTAPDAPHRLKMRCEYLCDALQLRLALAPWVLSWNEVELDNATHWTTGTRGVMSGADRSIEFEVTDNAPILDHLRWLLSKITDMHIPAESLNYAERYTGDRLPYDIVERMRPPEALIEELMKRLRNIAEAAPGLIEGLEEALVDC